MNYTYAEKSAPAMEMTGETPELRVALNSMDKLSSELAESVKGLEARLETVLLPSRPRPDGNPNSKDGVHSPAVAHLHGLTYMLQSILEQVNDIKSRLEV